MKALCFPTCAGLCSTCARLCSTIDIANNVKQRYSGSGAEAHCCNRVQDIEGVDPEYYKNLTWLLEHDMTDVVDLNFVEEVDYFGRVEHVELKPGGRDIKVLP